MVHHLDTTQFVEFNAEDRTFTTNPTNLDTPVRYFTGPVTAERIMPPLMRTMEQEVWYQVRDAIHTDGRMMPDVEWAEYLRLQLMAPYITNNPVDAISATPTPTVRTAEQEERWIYLRTTTIPWTPEDRQEYERLGRLEPHPHPLPVRTHVQVHRDSYNNWSVSVRVGTEQKDLPSIAVIKALINPADKHWLPSRQGRRHSTLRLLKVALEGGLSAQSLHDALRAWVMATENQVTDAESSIPASGVDAATATLLRAQPATLEVGGRVFRLVPAREIDVRPLITRVRQRTIAQARVETDALRERARTDARVVTGEAERQAARMRAEAEEAARRAGAKVSDWVRDSGRPHYYASERWYVEMKVNCFLRDIRFLVREWGVVLHWNPTRVANHEIAWYSLNENKCPLWFRVTEDGRYDKNSIFGSDWDTPHIGSYMCMELQNQPPVIRSIEHLVALEKAINRGMQVLNLNSPISRRVDNYHPAIKEQIPSIPAQFLKGDINIVPGVASIEEWQMINPRITWDNAESLVEEGRGTFNVGDPVPTLPVPPRIEPTVVQELAEMIQTAQAATVHNLAGRRE